MEGNLFVKKSTYYCKLGFSNVKTKRRLCQIFVAFAEYGTFTNLHFHETLQFVNFLKKVSELKISREDTDV